MKREIGRGQDHIPIMMDFDEAYSCQDFTRSHLREVVNLNGKNIYGSCFSREEPETKVFPDSMIGVTLVNCNLDNVFIPSGNVVIGGSERRFKVQNDLNDWEINPQGKPTRPTNHRIFTKLGLPIPLAADIPSIPRTKDEGPIDLIEEARKKVGK